MNFTFLYNFLTFWTLAFTYQVNERESPPPKLPLRPGDLLRSLDELTSDADLVYSPLQDGPAKTAERRVYNDENTNHGSEFDYDKAYEDFVSKYFAQGEEDLGSEDEDEKSIDSDSVSPYEATNETDDLDESASKTSKSKKCKRVKIDDQDCLVCEDPKTNEKSKSCSFSSESKPKNYKFSRERSKKSSKDDDGSEESAEAEQSQKREASPKNEKIHPRSTSIKEFVPSTVAAKDFSSRCTRKKENGMICYYCGTKSKHTRECMADENNLKNRHLDESSKKDSTTKKVFKRMVTYSFKNDGKPEVKKNTYAAFKGF